MGKSFKCDGPFPHSGKRTYSAYICEAYRAKAKEKFPEFDWNKILKLCLSCKNQVEAGPGRMITKKRGRKKPLSTEQDADGNNKNDLYGLIDYSQCYAKPQTLSFILVPTANDISNDNIDADSQNEVFQFMDGMEDDPQDASQIEYAIHAENVVDIGK